MLKIKESETKKKYEREIESMGEGLVLFKIRAIGSGIGYNNHIFYENDRKPPLDIALHPEDNTLVYLSFFLQDEKIKHEKFCHSIAFIKKNIEIESLVEYDYLNQLSIKKDFEAVEYDKNIVMLTKNNYDKILGYELNENNYILFDEMNELAGLFMMNITDFEYDNLKKSKVI